MSKSRISLKSDKGKCLLSVFAPGAFIWQNKVYEIWLFQMKFGFLKPKTHMSANVMLDDFFIPHQHMTDCSMGVGGGDVGRDQYKLDLPICHLFGIISGPS